MTDSFFVVGWIKTRIAAGVSIYQKKPLAKKHLLHIMSAL